MGDRASITSTRSFFLDESEFDFDFEILDEVQGISQWELLNISDLDSDCQSFANGELQATFMPASSEDIGNSADRDLHSTNEEDDDIDDGDTYEYELDDELIPRSETRKLKKQRMRKAGKRGFPKKLPYSSKRPGCIRGKHGLGLKHNQRTGTGQEFIRIFQS